MANEFIARNGLIAQNNSAVTGSLIITQGITGSLFGSSSYSLTSSFVQNAESASYVLQAVSSSFATTASFALNARTNLGLVIAISVGLQNIF